MAWPTLTLRMAFGSDPMDAVPAWTTITNDVRRIYIVRGRQHELDRMEAGTMMLELLNTHGDYWPLNAGGVHFPNVLPGKRVNLIATYNAVPYELYTGFIEDWNPDWLQKEGGLIPIVKPNCADLLNNLANFDINSAGYAQELSGTRVGNILDELGWLGNAATEILRPNAAGDQTNISNQFPVAGAHWDKVDEAIADEATTYIFDTGNVYKRDLYNLPASSGAGSINHIKVYFRVYSLGAAAKAKASIKAGVTVADGAEEDTVPGNWTTFSHQWITNPDDSAAWEWSDIDALQIGVSLKGNAAQPVCTQVYVEVNYNSRAGLDAGKSLIQASGAIEKENAIEHLAIVQQSELGIVYIAGDGDVQFEDRHHRLLNHQVSVATFGDDLGENFYHGMEPRYGADDIRNDINIKRDGGAQQSASDAASQTSYGKRSLSRDALLIITDLEAKDQAEYMLKRYKDPVMRNRILKVIPERDPSRSWPQVLGREISDRITVRRNEASIDLDYHIEGIIHDINLVDRTWSTQWQLSDADSQVYWVLEVVGFSELEETTFLAY